MAGWPLRTLSPPTDVVTQTPVSDWVPPKDRSAWSSRAWCRPETRDRLDGGRFGQGARPIREDNPDNGAAAGVPECVPSAGMPRFTMGEASCGRHHDDVQALHRAV